MPSQLSRRMGAGSPFLAYGAPATGISGTTLDLNTAFVNATSGTALAMRFCSPSTQSSATLTVYAYMTAKTGSPTNVKAAIFAGPSGAMDDDRPDTGAALGISGATDVSAQSANSWTTFTISSVSLTKGVDYWLVFYNDTATPASNYPTYMSRGWNGAMATRFAAYTTTNGFTTDPSAVSSSSEAPFVLAFADGTIMGCPYVVSTAHANNSESRGMRFTFDSAHTIVGLFSGFSATSATTLKVYNGASEVGSATLSLSQKNNAQCIYFDAPITFAAGVAYDVVWSTSSGSTQGARIGPGVSPPADVSNCMNSGIGYVTGTTPGSFTHTAGEFTTILLLVDNVPAASGGGLFRNPSLAGT